MEADVFELAAGAAMRGGRFIVLAQKYGIWAVVGPFVGWVVIAMGLDAWQSRGKAGDE